MDARQYIFIYISHRCLDYFQICNILPIQTIRYYYYYYYYYYYHHHHYYYYYYYHHHNHYSFFLEDTAGSSALAKIEAEVDPGLDQSLLPQIPLRVRRESA